MDAAERLSAFMIIAQPLQYTLRCLLGAYAFVTADSARAADTRLFTGGTAGRLYHELRIYTVTSNKMDGVMERFPETVEPVRPKRSGKLRSGVTTFKLTPTDFSALK